MEKEKLRGLLAIVNEFAKRHNLTVVDFKFKESYDKVETDELDGEIYIEDTNSELSLVCSGVDIDMDKVYEELEKDFDELTEEERESGEYAKLNNLECELQKAVAVYLGEKYPEVGLSINNRLGSSVVFEPKVELIKSVDDEAWGGMDKDYAIRSKINDAFSKRYLPWMGASPFKTFLQEDLGIIPQLSLSLIVKCKDGSNEVDDFGFGVDFAGDMDYLQYNEMRERFDLEKIHEAVVRNMKKIGYRVPCKTAIDVYRFTEELFRFVPEAKEYLKLSASFPIN